MPPPRPRLDPDGYYDRLGLPTDAAHDAVVAAFRQAARRLHPDVPGTGDTAAFVAVKQAYDILSSPVDRASYDRRAREAALDAIEPEVLDTAPAMAPDIPLVPRGLYRPRFSDLPLAVWGGVGAFLCLGVYEIVSHLLAPVPKPRTDIRPNAAIVTPLSPSAHQAVLYGPAPVMLAGTTNYYVVPAGSPAVLFRMDTERNALVPLGQLPPFSAVQGLQLMPQNGMREVLVPDRPNGFISADHLAPGNATAARRAYCSYNTGPVPADGEMLERRGRGPGTLDLDNRSVQPAVVKLRGEDGSVVLSVFLGPGGHAGLQGLPEGRYSAEFAIGELWSRACNTFAAGMRSRRLDDVVTLPGASHLEVAPDSADAPSSEISDQEFDRN